MSQKDIEVKKENFMKRLKEINNIIKEYPNQMIEVKVNNITKFINYELESDRLAKSYI